MEELLWVWHWMKKNGIEPGFYTYNFLMNGLLNSLFIKYIEKVLEIMENELTGDYIQVESL